jgi:hypothetical protein
MMGVPSEFEILIRLHMLGVHISRKISRLQMMEVPRHDPLFYTFDELLIYTYLPEA